MHHDRSVFKKSRVYRIINQTRITKSVQNLIAGYTVPLGARIYKTPTIQSRLLRREQFSNE